MRFEDFHKKQTMDSIQSRVQYHYNVLYNNHLTAKEHVLELVLRTSCKPVIKGKITKGKIKWRGLRFIEQNGDFWIEQRGVRICSKYNFMGQEIMI